MRVEIIIIAAIVRAQDDDFLIPDQGNRGAVFNIDECSGLFSCIKFPICELADNGCAVAAWRYVDNEIEIALHLTTESDSWVGIGFSTDTSMGNDDIFYCQNRAGTIGVVSAYSTGMSRPVNVDGSAHVSNVGATRSPGSFQCSFRRPASVTKNNIQYNLESGSWFILLSFGALAGNEEQYHGSSVSGVAIASAQSVRFGQNVPTQFFAGTAVSGMPGIRAHAFLMFFAWGCLIPSGLFIARFFRSAFPQNKMGAVDMWFQLHRGLMIFGVVLTVIAVIVIFATRNGWSASAGAHAIVGIIVISLAIVNPILALFRPKPKSDNRIYFNLCHHSIGYIATLLGYVTIFLGFDLALFDLDFSTTQLFAATVTIISAFSIVLELYKSKLENYSFFNMKLYSILSLLYFIFLFIMTVVVLSRISTFMPTS